MSIIKKYLDYKRRKELDKQARDLWVDTFSTIHYKDVDKEKGISHANGVVAAFYDAFYPRNKS